MPIRFSVQTLGAALVVLALAGPALAQGANCNQPAKAAVLSVPLPGAPAAMASSPDGCTVYVAIPAKGSGASRIAVVSRAGGQATVARVIATSGSVVGLSVSPDGKRLAAATGANVTLFDAARVLAGQPDPIVAVLDEAGAASVLFAKDGARLYAGNPISNTLGVWDVAGRKRLASLPIGLSPGALVLSPDGRSLYVADRLTDGKEAECSSSDGQASWTSPGELVVVDTAKTAIGARASAGCTPSGLAVSASGDRVYVAAQGDGAVKMFGAGGVAAGTLKAGEAPIGIAAGQRLFVGAEHAISVLDPAKGLSGAAPVSGSPSALAFTPDGRALLAAASAPDALLILDPVQLGR